MAVRAAPERQVPERPAGAPAERVARRVVIVAYHFPPDPAVGSVRAERVARAFRARGWEVDVVTAHLPEVAASRDRQDGIRVFPVRLMLHPRAVLVALRDALRPPSRAAEPAGPPAAYKVPARMPTWKRWILSFVWMPDDRQPFILPAAWRAWRLVRRGRADLLYSTSPPHSLQVAGLLVRWLSGVRWVVELRDPWTDNRKAPQFRSRWSEAIERWLERRCLARAARVVAVSEATGQLLRDRIDHGAGRVVVARNGIDRIRPVEAVVAGAGPAVSPDGGTARGPLRVLHAGSLYFGRDPSPFLRALGALRARGGLPARSMRVEFIGEGRWFRGQSIEQLGQDLGIADLLHFVDRVPYAECQRLTETADLLLLLAQNQPLQVPQKLYDYLGTRRPILAFVDDRGESAALLRQAGGHHLATDADAEHVAAVVRDALVDAERTEARGDAAVLEEWTVGRQMERLVRTLEER